MHAEGPLQDEPGVSCRPFSVSYKCAFRTQKRGSNSKTLAMIEILPKTIQINIQNNQVIKQVCQGFPN